MLGGMSVARVAVFGAAGQLGSELVKTFESLGHDVRGLKRGDVDVSDAPAVQDCIAGLRPTLVVNAAAYNLVDAAETDPAAAWLGNALAVRNLALACAQQRAKLIHYSTDYVFDGTLGRPNRETDPVRPLGAYGVSKLAGEGFAQAYCEDALILRVAAVFGPAGATTPRGNFVETMLRLASQGKPLRIVADQITSPTYTVALAERTAALWQAGASGLFHAGGGTPISWHDFAAMIFRKAGVAPALEPIGTADYPTPARRPAYSALGNVKLASVGLPPFPPLEACVDDYLNRTGRSRG
jgi:dTDP-4-dehydrorhamnose reductase